MRQAALEEAARVEAEATTTATQPRKAGLFGDDQPNASTKLRVDVEAILQGPAKRQRTR